MKDTKYDCIIVESYMPADTFGLHGPIHIRPVPGQSPYETHMHVECSKKLSYDYPVGTKFKIQAKITDREGGTPFIYSHYSWHFQVLSE